jgi:DNA primase
MRVPAGAFKSGPSSLGEYYLHRIEGDHRQDAARRSAPSLRPPATTGRCDAVYSRILESLTLSSEHAVQLLRRGLDEEAIIRNLYASVPTRSALIALSTEVSGHVDVEGVPGLWRSREGWQMVAEEGELLIPIRDHRFLIVALCRRTNDPQRRYLWVSSKASPSGSPPQHSEPWNAELRPVLYLTEGPLKADIIAARLAFTTIGLAGAGNIPPGLGATLREAYPNVVSAFIAFDADLDRKPAVEAGRNRLVESLTAAGYRVRLIEWDEADGKGLDDVLVRVQG